MTNMTARETLRAGVAKIKQLREFDDEVAHTLMTDDEVHALLSAILQENSEMSALMRTLLGAILQVAQDGVSIPRPIMEAAADASIWMIKGSGK